MVTVCPDSLAETLDALNEALFTGANIDPRDRYRVGMWITERIGGPRSYRGLFAPTAWDWEHGFHLFTGEAVSSRARTCHVLGEEAAHALALLHLEDESVRRALEIAATQVADFGIQPHHQACYCCGTCSMAMIRHLHVAPLADAEARIANGLTHLKACRKGDGRWQRYPFYYTLLVLSELQSQQAIAEMRYAAPRCERLLNIQHGPYAERRQLLLERVLARC